MRARPDSEEGPEQLAAAPLISHLVELRQRLVRSALAVLVAFVCLAPFRRKVFDFVAAPLMAKLPEGSQMIATHPASPFITPFRTTLFVALFAAMPVVLYQFWAFVSPGLYKREKRFVVPMLASSVVLFYLGIAFAYYAVFPLMFGFFTRAAPAGVHLAPDISQYLGFVLTLFLAFGVAFEVPIATVLAVWTRLVSLQKVRRYRPYVFLVCFIVGMFLTPPDVVSQTLLAVPMYALYECGILMARIFVRPKTTGDDDSDV